MKDILAALAVTLLFFTACGNTDGKNKEMIAAQIARIDSVWQQQPQAQSAQEIISFYNSVARKIGKGNATLHKHNQCHYIWYSGEYIFKCRGKNSDIQELAKHVGELSLDDSCIDDFVAKEKNCKFIDHYFTLMFMKAGSSFEEARDGITATVFFHIRPLNENDFEKLRQVFSSKNSTLHNAYLKRLKFPLTNSGCSNGLKSIQPLIEKNVAESNLKKEILDIYEVQSRLMQGMPAPISELKDTKGNTRTFSEMRGSVVVIDVWATWCSSCIKNMPKFIALGKEYEKRDDVKFITISIDRSEEKELWLKAIEKNGMKHMLNLFPDCDLQSQFETDYQIQGVPRYIIIDKKGNIISAYAPSEPAEIKELIEKAL